MNVCRPLAWTLVVWGCSIGSASAQLYSPGCACLPDSTGQVYRMVYQTVYDQQQVTACRIEYDTVYQDRQVTTYRPVWETQMQERRYTVGRPIQETSMREERYTVMRPVVETQERVCNYEQVRFVQETAEREERCTVWRPVQETCQRQECYTVLQPVRQTTYRTEYQTVHEPVETCQTVLVDRGGYVDQVTERHGLFRNRLAWQPAMAVMDPCTGCTRYQRGGLHWVPNVRQEVQRVWMPNLVPQQVTQVQMVPRMVARQVPVEVCSYQEQQVCRMVPYSVTRMVAEEQVRRVPYTVSRPVVERMERRIPVQVTRMVAEEQVRQIPVTVQRMAYEERVEQIPIRVCRMEAVQETVRVPQCVERRVPITYTCTVPRTVCCRMPVEPCATIAAEIVGPALSPETCTVQPAAPGSPSTFGSPTPTPADKKAGGADVAPSLSKDRLPGPVTEEESQAKSPAKPEAKEAPSIYQKNDAAR